MLYAISCVVAQTNDSISFGGAQMYTDTHTKDTLLDAWTLKLIDWIICRKISSTKFVSRSFSNPDQINQEVELDSRNEYLTKSIILEEYRFTNFFRREGRGEWTVYRDWGQDIGRDRDR
jgi:hypothetical protein